MKRRQLNRNDLTPACRSGQGSQREQILRGLRGLTEHQKIWGKEKTGYKPRSGSCSVRVCRVRIIENTTRREKRRKERGRRQRKTSQVISREMGKDSGPPATHTGWPIQGSGEAEKKYTERREVSFAGADTLIQPVLRRIERGRPSNRQLSQEKHWKRRLQRSIF